MLHLHNILNGIWLMEPSAVTNYLPLIASWLKGTQTLQAVAREHDACATMQGSAYRIPQYNGQRAIANLPENSIAIIPVEGVMTQHDQACGDSGMKTKAAMLQQCYANPNIKGVMFEISSPGGEAYSAITIQNVIAERNKPVFAFFADTACSAAYIGFSGCDLIFAANEFVVTGSIGTIKTIADYSKQLEKEGVILTEIYASQSTEKNAEVKAALNGDFSLLQAQVDYFNDNFVLKSVATFREKTLKGNTEWKTGKTLYAPEALKLGLIDDIESLENMVSILLQQQ